MARKAEASPKRVPIPRRAASWAARGVAASRVKKGEFLRAAGEDSAVGDLGDNIDIFQACQHLFEIISTNHKEITVMIPSQKITDVQLSKSWDGGQEYQKIFEM